MIFQSFPAFFAVYIPLVILAIFAIIFEEKLIEFEQRIKIQVKKLFIGAMFPANYLNK